jgi:adenylosuccinate synthase
MLSSQVFQSQLRLHLERANRSLEKIYKLDGVDIEAAIEAYQAFADQLQPHLVDTGHFLSQALLQGRRVLGEGAQGTLLDLDHGTYPFVTSSHPTAPGALLGLGVGPQHLERVIGVAKAFQTRVGEGPFPSEIHGAAAERLRGSGDQPWDEYGTTTGRPRRCGWLDLVLLRYAQRVNGFTELALTKLDILSGLEALQLCTGYHDGVAEYSHLVDGPSELGKYQPVLEAVPGWDQDITAVRSWDDLPREAQKYVRNIEAAVAIPARMLSVGPERDQIIQRQGPKTTL